MHGKCVFIKISGTKFEGTFEEGKPAKGIKYYKNGKIKTLKWFKKLFITIFMNSIETAEVIINSKQIKMMSCN